MQSNPQQGTGTHIWTLAAAGMGGGFFALFGVVFIFIAIVQAVYHLKNATGENRYSSFDITDGNEEPDPLNEYFGQRQTDSREDDQDFNQSVTRNTSRQGGSAFCPYCGTPVEGDFAFCNKCGKKLP